MALMPRKSPFAVAALFVCLWGPVVVLGGVAGRLVDRHENRRLLIGVSLVQAAVVAAQLWNDGKPIGLFTPAMCGLLAAAAAFAMVTFASSQRRVV